MLRIDLCKKKRCRKNNKCRTANSFFEDRDDASDEMAIKKTSGKWIVYATNERVSKITGGETIYETEKGRKNPVTSSINWWIGWCDFGYVFNRF